MELFKIFYIAIPLYVIGFAIVCWSEESSKVKEKKQFDDWLYKNT